MIKKILDFCMRERLLAEPVIYLAKLPREASL
jgi:hypothetical protein